MDKNNLDKEGRINMRVALQKHLEDTSLRNSTEVLLVWTLNSLKCHYSMNYQAAPTSWVVAEQRDALKVSE